MPYVTDWEEPEIYLQHKGVTVYRTYKDNEPMMFAAAARVIQSRRG